MYRSGLNEETTHNLNHIALFDKLSQMSCQIDFVDFLSICLGKAFG